MCSVGIRWADDNCETVTAWIARLECAPLLLFGGGGGGEGHCNMGFAWTFHIICKSFVRQYSRVNCQYFNKDIRRVLRSVSIKCETCVEAAGGQFQALVWNKVGWTAGVIGSIHPRRRQASYSATFLATATALRPKINPLKTKSRQLYLKTQFVPRSKHFSSGL